MTPDNILISHNGAIKLGDFGVTKAFFEYSDVTKVGQVKGKFGYMSPEQIHSQSLDGRSDLFSLGVVLYEMLAGKKPFQAKSDAASIKMLLQQNPKPLKKLRPDISTNILALVEHCLDKDKKQRFCDARALQIAIERIMANRNQLVSTKELSLLVNTHISDIKYAQLKKTSKASKSYPHTPIVQNKVAPSLGRPVTLYRQKANPKLTPVELNRPKYPQDIAENNLLTSSAVEKGSTYFDTPARFSMQRFLFFWSLLIATLSLAMINLTDLQYSWQQLRVWLQIIH